MGATTRDRQEESQRVTHPFEGDSVRHVVVPLTTPLAALPITSVDSLVIVLNAPTVLLPFRPLTVVNFELVTVELDVFVLN